MAFKMKNQSMAKLTKAAGNSRVAMKMKAESAMKMKSATKKDLPEVRITEKKEEKKEGLRRVTKDLKYPFSKNKFGDITYKGDILSKRDVAKIKDSDLYERNPVKPEVKVDSAVPMKKGKMKEFKKLPKKKAKLIPEYSKVSGLQITSGGKEVRQSMAGPAGKTLVNKQTNREIDKDYRAANQPKAKLPEDMPKGKKKRRTKRFERRAMKS